MAIMVKDHAKLHEAVARAALAGGAGALAALFLPAGLGMAVTVIALGVAIVPPTSWSSAAWALLWACGAGAAAQRGGGVLATLAGAAAVGGTLARGVGGWRRLVAFVAGGLGAATAALIARAFATTGALGFLPSGIEALAMGAIGGAVVGVSSIGRHVEVVRAAVESELTGLESEGELGALLGRAAAAYREAIEALGDQAPAARAAADDLVRKMARFGRRWREVEAEASRTLPDELRERLYLIGRRLEATNDPQTRVDFERAREAVTAQLAYLDEISRGRERAVARITHQVATLERLRLAAVRHRSVDAARLGAELQPVVEEISEAGGDLDLASEALNEATVVAALPPAGRPPASA
jgi:hypothetical protein